MTTNRLEQMDEAFRSRITMTIPYPQLRRDGLNRILRTLIYHRIETDEKLYVKMEVFEKMDHYLEDDKASWINGRALNSLVKSAISLASSQAAREGERPIFLSWKEFRPLLIQAEALSRYERGGFIDAKEREPKDEQSHDSDQSEDLQWGRANQANSLIGASPEERIYKSNSDQPYLVKRFQERN